MLPCEIVVALYEEQTQPQNQLKKLVIESILSKKSR